MISQRISSIATSQPLLAFKDNFSTLNRCPSLPHRPCFVSREGSLSGATGGGLSWKMTDVQRLSGFLQVDAAVIEQEQWSQILPALILRATEYEQLKSRTFVLEVEVEQANKQAESRVAAVRSQLDSTLADLEKERTSIAHSESEAGNADSKFEALESEKKEMQEQIVNLRTTNQQLTEEKRQALAMVDRQSQNASRFEEEYKSLSGRYHALRKDTTTLEAQVHEARSAASNAQVGLASSSVDRMLTL